MDIYGWFAKLIAKIGKELVVFGGIIAGLALLLLGHKRSVSKAEKQGEETGAYKEQIKLQEETRVRTEKIKEKANEIKQEIEADTAAISDLRDRMRQSAVDSGSK